MVLLKCFFIGFLSNNHGEPVLMISSVTQNTASSHTQLGGGGDSFDRAKLRLLLPCVCTRVREHLRAIHSSLRKTLARDTLKTASQFHFISHGFSFEYATGFHDARQPFRHRFIGVPFMSLKWTTQLWSHCESVTMLLQVRVRHSHRLPEGPSNPTIPETSV